MTWNLNPIAFSLLGLDVRWYGIAYITGFFLALWIGKIIYQHLVSETLEEDEFENLVFRVFFSGVLGGRIGFFLFYHPETLLTDPLEFFKVWHGGMSIHGGVILGTLYLIWHAHKNKLSILKLIDVFTLPLSIALVLGRIANFINGELVGRPTEVSWAVIFPHIDSQPRHPSQLYEAIKNLLNVIVLTIVFIKDWALKPGLMTSIFLIGYGIYRFLIEYVREPEIMIGPFTMGQVLCLAMIAGGITIISLQWKEWHGEEVKI